MAQRPSMTKIICAGGGLRHGPRDQFAALLCIEEWLLGAKQPPL